MTIRSRSLAIACLLLAASPATAAPGEVRLYEENDFFNFFTERTDRYYTQGLKLEFLASTRASDTRFLPGISHDDWCRLLCGEGYNLENVNTGIAVGQNMYTPAVITISRPQPNDRPWAGLAYVSRIARVSYLDTSLNAQRQDRIEFAVGVVGPASLAGETQRWWHRVIEDDRPAGWANQLRNEPVLQFRYETALRWPREDKEGFSADIIPRFALNLGNALVSAEGEVRGRIGWDLTGFGVGTITMFAPPPPMSALAPGPRPGGSWRPSGNLFLRAGVKAIAHNIFLDGNTFARNNILIERTPFVGEIAAGIELNFCPHISATFQFIHRGSEFEDRFGRQAPAQEFGALTLAVTYGR